MFDPTLAVRVTGVCFSEGSHSVASVRAIGPGGVNSRRHRERARPCRGVTCWSRNRIRGRPPATKGVHHRGRTGTRTRNRLRSSPPGAGQLSRSSGRNCVKKDTLTFFFLHLVAYEHQSLVESAPRDQQELLVHRPPERRATAAKDGSASVAAAAPQTFMRED